jgi:hypothetical protein
VCFLIYWLAIIFTSFSGTLENLLKCVDQVEGESIRKVESSTWIKYLLKSYPFLFPLNLYHFLLVVPLFDTCNEMKYLPSIFIKSVVLYLVTLLESISVCLFWGLLWSLIVGSYSATIGGGLVMAFSSSMCLGMLHALLIMMCNSPWKEDVEVCHQGYCTSRKYKLIYHVMILCSWNLR